MNAQPQTKPNTQTQAPQATGPMAVRESQLKHALMGVRKQVESLLGDKSRSDKFMAAALVVSQDRSLAGCRPESITQALVGVAMADLNVDKNVGHCYLIKYGNDVQLQVGYRGFIQLLFRAGWQVKAMPVFKCDYFKMSFNGWDNLVDFEPAFDERDEGNKNWVYENLRGIYTVARNTETKDEVSTFLPKKVIEKLRKVSPNQQNKDAPVGIWADWYVEMATAKAIKKLAKQLPIGDRRVAAAIAVDDHNDIGRKVDYARTADTGVIVEADPEPSARPVADINDVISGKQTQAAPEAPDETNWPDLINNSQSLEELKVVETSIPKDRAGDFAELVSEQYDFLRNLPG